MTQTVQEFAALNDYEIDKAESIVRGWAEDASNPAFKKLAQSWLEASDL